MADLDAASRALELRNLPTSVKVRRNGDLSEELNRCRERLLAANLAQPEHRTFATPLAALPVVGELVRWASSPVALLNAPQVGEILHRSLDPLGIPMPTATDFGRLFDTFSPVWEVDVMDNDNHIGTPCWDKGPLVNVAHPTVYRKVSHTR